MDEKGSIKRQRPGKDFCYDFNQIAFPSVRMDTFRATLKSCQEGVLLWLESKKTKDQWQATVENVSDCGPAGVPADAVIQFLKVRLNALCMSCSLEIIVKHCFLESL